MRSRYVFRARREGWRGQIEIAIGDRCGEGSEVTHSARPIEFAPIGPHDEIRDWISLSADDAQALVDELWTLGVRPSEWPGSAGSLAATERHLADMQRVAFGFLERLTEKKGRC